MMPQVQPLSLFAGSCASPIGKILIVFDDDKAMRALDFEDYEDRMFRLLRRHYGEREKGYTMSPRPLPGEFTAALQDYFAGNTQALDGIVVRTGGTPFQKSVWSALRGIPAGTTLSYGALADRLDSPRAVRAVGLANGANPISIVVPCHRVIGADGSLTGYGGGLERKQWLLNHEGALSASQEALF